MKREVERRAVVAGRTLSAIRDRTFMVAAAVVGLGLLTSTPARAASTLGVDFRELAGRCAPSVHPTTLSAIVMQESGAKPFAIGINGGTVKLQRQPRTRAEAIATATWLRNGGHNFDAGLGQINVKNMSWLGLEVADLFDPCKNLQAAAVVIGDCYERAARRYGGGQQALRAALSCYNTGNFQRGFANGYVGKVGGRIGAPVPAVRFDEPNGSLPAASAPEVAVAGAAPSAPREIADVFASARPGVGGAP